MTVTYTPANVGELSAVDYFRAKLEFESTPHQLQHDIEEDKVQILDVRDAESFKKEHITGAINLPLAEIGQNLSKLPRNKTIVTYCWNLTCALAPKAALALAEKGYKVQELVGGIQEWKNKGFPVEGQ